MGRDRRQTQTSPTCPSISVWREESEAAALPAPRRNKSAAVTTECGLSWAAAGPGWPRNSCIVIRAGLTLIADNTVCYWQRQRLNAGRTIHLQSFCKRWRWVGESSRVANYLFFFWFFLTDLTCLKFCAANSGPDSNQLSWTTIRHVIAVDYVFLSPLLLWIFELNPSTDDWMRVCATGWACRKFNKYSIEHLHIPNF